MYFTIKMSIIYTLLLDIWEIIMPNDDWTQKNENMKAANTKKAQVTAGVVKDESDIIQENEIEEDNEILAEENEENVAIDESIAPPMSSLPDTELEPILDNSTLQDFDDPSGPGQDSPRPQPSSGNEEDDEQGEGLKMK